MPPNRLRTAAEEELMEARLDNYNQKRKSSKDTEPDEAEDKPARRSRKFEGAEAKAGRWVAPVILGLTVMVSAIFWLLQKLHHP
jgi:hypothetical protein